MKIRVHSQLREKNLTKGFTIVELSVVVVIIGILAGLVVVSYNGWQRGINQRQVKSDLQMTVSAMQSAKNFGSGYPTSLPSTLRASDGVVLEMTSASAGTYCVNGYSVKDSSIRMSVSSSSGNTIRNYLCNTPGNGSTIGGTVPNAPLGVDIAPSFADWTLTNGATYNASNGELTLGVTGRAVSPMMRVNGVAGMNVNGQFYATAQSAQASLQPYGGWHTNASYYAADATTPTNNTWNYTANGCARTVTLGGWNASRNGDCGYALGNSIVYATVTLFGSNGGYASTDLKIRDFSIVLY